MTMFAQLSKCLYCVWPALVAGIAWWLSRGVEGKTYYGSLTPSVDPVSAQGQAEFETRRQRDSEKRRIIYWAAGIIAVGYLLALGFNTFTLRAAAAQPTSTPTWTITPTPTLTQTKVTLTFTPTLPSQTISPTKGTGTPTYIPTATDRIVYIAGARSTVVVTALVQKQVIVVATVLVPQQVTVIVTPISTSSPMPTQTASPTGTSSPTWTTSPTQTASPTQTQTPTGTATPTGTDTPTSTLQGDTP